MSIDKDVLLMLGRMDGKLDGIAARQNQQDSAIKDLGNRVDTGMQRLDSKIDKNHTELDQRLRDVEKKSAVVGAVGGSAAGIGVALLVEGIKTWLRGGNGGL